MAGGRKSKRRSGKRHGSKRHGRSRKVKGGNGVIATAAVPFGLLALQRYFMHNKTAKQGVKNMGNSFKRTFRRKL
jgi:alpha-glucuronidase